MREATTGLEQQQALERQRAIPLRWPLGFRLEDDRVAVRWCEHSDQVHDVTPSALGCEECLKTGSAWVHLRLCRTCGHVGCCDSSPNRHATAHFHATGHPIIEGYDPPEGWGWCYIDEAEVKIGPPTPQRGPIKRWV
jgi:hypothetical protein